MTVSFQGFNQSVATFAGTVQAGKVVKVNAPGAVVACPGDGVFCGVAGGGSGGYLSVQLTGYVSLPYSGTAPVVGYGKLVADAAGGVKTGTGGREYLIVDVDTARKTVGFLLA